MYIAIYRPGLGFGPHQYGGALPNRQEPRYSQRLCVWTQLRKSQQLDVKCVCESGQPCATTPLGKVLGTTRTSFGGTIYSAFEGIPYAKPPIGDRRFEAPEPIGPWFGSWNATFLTECIQTSESPKQFDEDCLHINVYVPRATPNPSERLDVIVHIHGGSFEFCSGHCYTTPKYLMDHDVIFVTFNYRLGIFGFLSTEDNVVPGNNGLKDQVLALKWVQNNIASFGGNPASVTLNGASSGSVSVHLHYLSDMSKSLFHRGYSQSGVALNPFSVQKGALAKAKMLANAVGCPTGRTRTMVQCLKQKPHQHLQAQLPLYNEVWFFPGVPFAPVVEKGRRAFLTADPYELIRQGKVYDVPWIASNTIHEGNVIIPFLNDNIQTLDEKWEEWAPYIFKYNYTLSKAKWATTARKIKKHYLGNQKIKKDNLMKVVQMFSDRDFNVGAEDAVREQAKVTRSPVYYYLFGYPGDNNADGLVGHIQDTKFMYNDDFGPEPLTPNELKMKDILLNNLIAYAKTGRPSIKGVDWKPTGYDQLTYLKIDGYEHDKIKLEKVNDLTPRQFWKSLGFKEGENLI